ncbi:MAG: hypothetical protein ACJ8GN_11765 [Longimicrobiaceae bacterium]
MKKAFWSLAAVAAALAMAGGASAQACAGFPTAKGQGTFGGVANFPTGLHQVGAEGSYHAESPFGLNGAVLSSFNENATLITFRGGVAFEVPTVERALPGLSLCPVVRADFSTRSGLTFWQVPIGVGVGVTVPVQGPGTTLSGYAIPALMWEKLSGAGASEVTETHFAARGGVNLSVSRFFLGGTLEWVDAPGIDATFGVRAGVKF